jgi:site-specific DNA-methyltransferase (adenine-specific)
MNFKAHRASNNFDWSTPQSLFDGLDREFGFTLDVCANSHNAKCRNFFCPLEDGLTKEWGRNICWMNPPYGKWLPLWLRKGYQESLKDATVVCLIPSRTDTAWWHDIVIKGEIRFLRGRLKFGDGKKTAPFPSAIVVFRPQAQGIER